MTDKEIDWLLKRFGYRAAVTFMIAFAIRIGKEAFQLDDEWIIMFLFMIIIYMAGAYAPYPGERK